MKGRSDGRRVNTETTLGSLYEKSIKVRGTIVIMSKPDAKIRNNIIEVKPNNKLVFHCYKRYKSFPYQLDLLLEHSDDDNDIGMGVGLNNALQSLQNGVDYMMYVTGIFDPRPDRDVQAVEMLFYQNLTNLYGWVHKLQGAKLRLNFVCVREEVAIDLMTEKNVEIRENSSSSLKTGLIEICFYGAKDITVETPLQIYQNLQNAYRVKQKIMESSYLIVYGEVIFQSLQKRKILLINSTKKQTVDDIYWDNGSALVLNKCILSLYDKIEHKNKEAYCPFRDSKITRIMKPFLTLNAKVDAVGFINSYDEETPYSTLNLVKNLSRLKVPVVSLSSQILNPEAAQLQAKLKQLLQKSEGKSLKADSESQQKTRQITVKPESRVNLFEQVRKKAKQQAQSSRKLCQVRTQMKILKKRKQISIIGLTEMQRSSLLNNLEQQQIVLKQEAEKNINAQIQTINKSRLKTIQQSISKVQKLKLLKQYYTISLSQQKEEIESYLQQQRLVSKFYHQKLELIELNLRKSPKQLLGEQTEATPSTTKRRHTSVDIAGSPKFPAIGDKTKSRVAYLKEKLKKGRSDYSDFLTKNMSQYQSYSTPIRE